MIMFGTDALAASIPETSLVFSLHRSFFKCLAVSPTSSHSVHIPVDLYPHFWHRIEVSSFTGFKFSFVRPLSQFLSALQTPALTNIRLSDIGCHSLGCSHLMATNDRSIPFCDFTATFHNIIFIHIRASLP